MAGDKSFQLPTSEKTTRKLTGSKYAVATGVWHLGLREVHPYIGKISFFPRIGIMDS